MGRRENTSAAGILVESFLFATVDHYRSYQYWSNLWSVFLRLCGWTVTCAGVCPCRLFRESPVPPQDGLYGIRNSGTKTAKVKKIKILQWSFSLVILSISTSDQNLKNKLHLSYTNFMIIFLAMLAVCLWPNYSSPSGQNFISFFPVLLTKHLQN